MRQYGRIQKIGQRAYTMTTVISGEENTRAAQSMAQLHYWRMQANMKIKFGMRPRWTIAMFNEMYGVKAKSWQDIYKATNDTILEMRAEATNIVKCPGCHQMVDKTTHEHFGRKIQETN